MKMRAAQKDTNALALERVETALHLMGWNENNLASGIYKELGYKSKKGVTHWFNRSRRFPDFDALVVTCAYLGLDTQYVLGLHDDLHSSADPQGRFAIATRQATGSD